MPTTTRLLTDKEILELINTDQLKIEPLTLNQLQPASVDLRLGNHIARILSFGSTTPPIDITKPEAVAKQYKEEEIPDGEPIIIQPKEFILATTVEYLELPPNISGFITGRSSIGRLGLFVENAGWIDAGFKGQITLELFNANPNPIAIYPKTRICQVIFFEHEQPIEPYDGKYQGQRGATPSRIYKDEDLDF